MRFSSLLPAVLFVASGLLSGCGSETCVTKVAVYDDADGDGYGFGSDVGKGCPESPGEGHSSNNRDCNDADDSVFPDADEICDFVDNDCDGGSTRACVKPRGTPTVTVTVSAAGSPRAPVRRRAPSGLRSRGTATTATRS